MAFHIYDPRGYRIPFHPGDKWRKIGEVVKPAAFDEKSRDPQNRDHQGSFQEEEQTLLKQQYAGKITPIVASQIMSSPVTTLPPDALLKEAWLLFDKKRFRHIPIISTDGKIIGIISDRIMLHETVEFVKHVPEGEDNRKVGEVMAVNVLCAELNVDISQIAKIFIEEHVGAMPVIDRNGTLKGMLTRSDILRTIIKISPPEFLI